eukprot:CAMPEP_0206585188 /NCGR_PEP_ID=MMETSP0325_2-20121206/36264_1 /ASSEMBLY_ACC=CAM_ASM_000347 /TAXON_ID=2866 /ORGANISM="Crypthecodinium cohnii, Strain Seligo" /LENGTH=109 /DNA_ID=CAMNT_0054092679 /DNA_START=385 /DNA_END=715 /DNA_ORIENTATION=-
MSSKEACGLASIQLSGLLLEDQESVLEGQGNGDALVTAGNPLPMHLSRAVVRVLLGRNATFPVVAAPYEDPTLLCSHSTVSVSDATVGDFMPSERPDPVRRVALLHVVA